MAQGTRRRKSVILRLTLLAFAVYTIVSMGSMEMQLMDSNKQLRDLQNQTEQQKSENQQLLQLLENGSEKAWRTSNVCRPIKIRGGTWSFMQLKVGEIVEGKVTGITNFGVFVDLGEGKTGMVHISEVAQTYVSEIRDFVKDGETVKVKIMTVGEDGKVSLSMKRAVEQPRRPAPRQPGKSPGRPDSFVWSARRNDSMSFEDMMSKFKQSSDEKFSDLKRKGVDNRRPTKRGSK